MSMPPRHQPPPAHVSQAQPPKKKSSFIVWWLGISCTLVASCVGWCGYTMYEAQTPEGKRETAEHDAKLDLELDTFASKMLAIRKGLAPIHAQSSDEVSYGGGVQLKLHGIPTPTMGKTDLDEAVDKDFVKNLDAARKAALASIGAS